MFRRLLKHRGCPDIGMERAEVTWRKNYIAVDWGTTNRRAWLVDGAGNVADKFADDLGLTKVPENGFEQAAADIRLKLGPWPMLLAGMVGSNKGWRNVPYLPCPVDTEMLARGVMWIEPRHTGIVPGVSQLEGHADVMRGEEVQALGALAAGLVAPDVLICHPGTHTKWIRLRGGRIAEFRTMMTGEMFDLLRHESLLAAQMQSDVTDNASFQAGLEKAVAGAPLLSALFSIRAQHLLLPGATDGASFASGLLIGNDVQAGLSWAETGEKIAVMGRDDLCQLYAKAIAQAGFDSIIIAGEEAFLAGIRAITQQFQTSQDI